MSIDWAFAAEVFPHLVHALRITAWATLAGMVLASLLGFVLTLARRSPIFLLSSGAYWCMEFLRSTPLLIQIYFMFYVLPSFGVRLNPMTTGIITLGLHYSAYLSEVYRAGIESVPKGQWDAARALNFTPAMTWRFVILPQAIRPAMPAMGNYLIAMFKDTPMLSTITVLEVLQTAKILGAERFRYLEPLTIVGGLFLALSLLSSVLIRIGERKLGRIEIR